MKLGELIKQYRTEHGLSQRKFAEMCGVTNGYISMLENGKNPKTNEPIVPSLATIHQIAQAMNTTLHRILDECEDMPITIDDVGFALYHSLDANDKAEIRGTMRHMLQADKYKKN